MTKDNDFYVEKLYCAVCSSESYNKVKKILKKIDKKINISNLEYKFISKAVEKGDLKIIRLLLDYTEENNINLVMNSNGNIIVRLCQ